MARATVDVSLRADVKQLIDGLANVQNVTKKEARAMVAEMRKGYKEQVRAAQIAAKIQQKAIRATGKQTEKTTEHTLDVLQKSATEMSAVFGVGLLGDLEGVFDIARQSSERFGMGAAAAFAGVAGVAAISIAAVQQYTEAQRALNREIAASAESLEGFVSPEMLAALQAFAGEIELVDLTMERLAAESLLKSKDAAIEFEQAVVAVTTLGLPQWVGGAVSEFDTLSAALTVADGKLALVAKLLEAVQFGTEAYGKSLIDQTRALHESSLAMAEEREMLIALGMLEDEGAKVTDKNADAKRKQADAARRLRQELADLKSITIDMSDVEAEAATERRAQIEEGMRQAADITKLRNLERKAIEGVVGADDMRIQKMSEELMEMDALSRAYPEAVENAEALAYAKALLKEEIEKVNAQIDAEKFSKLQEDLGLAAQATAQLTDAMAGFAGLALDRFAELAENRRRQEEDRIDREADRHRQEVANLLESGAITQKQADGRLQTINRETAARKRGITSLTREEQKAAKRAFAVQQAGATAAVIMSGAEAYVAMLAALAPILTFGAPLAAAGIVGPAVAAQLAAIAAQKPPEFPSGGMVSPDHMVVGVQRDEGIVSRRGVAALGGPAALDQINRGISAGQEMTAQIILDRRVIGRAVAAMMPQTRTNRPIGQVPIYGVR